MVNSARIYGEPGKPAVTWVKTMECSICGDMVVGMSVNCIARQEYGAMRIWV